MKFKDIQFPPTYKYSSDSDYIPLEFYEDTFPISKSIDLLLGYFSSNALKVLSRCFAEFVFNEGKLRIVTNHFLSLSDFENLIQNKKVSDEDKIIDIFGDIEKLQKELSKEGQHFFDCLRYLQKEGRLEILPVKFNKFDLAHCKRMILFDGENYISTDGSINFTLSALIRNAESFQIDTSWGGEVSIARIKEERELFEKIITKTHPDYSYIDNSEIEVIINKIGHSKEIQDLMEDSIDLTNKSKMSNKVKDIIKKKKERFEESVNISKGLPRFPYPNGAREYQNEAYKNWENKSYSGIFAMATGTGKTITSLNCLLNEYKKENFYKAIILVPSIALLNQWKKEVDQFSFSKVLKVGGGSNWEKSFANFVSNTTWGINEDLIIISTYGSFVTDRFQKYFNKVSKDFTLIADEAHNMGANNIKKKLKSTIVRKKIGLSATPKRIYDLEGTDAIDDFFCDKPPYTYSFSMQRALKEGFLSEYKYFPKIVELDEIEYEEYIEISKTLLKFFDFEKGEFKKYPIVNILLLKRKNLIHKVKSKIECFKNILLELKKDNKLKYVFTYIPEGYVYLESGESEKILDKFIHTGAQTVTSLKMNSYTSEDGSLNEILRGFSEGKIDVLFAMKMLDEGVDVPRAEVGIFCSSTGNPRQFIQRRGRLLRKHPEKEFARIYDMVVIPKLNASSMDYFNMEQNMVKSELRRVAYFASLSMNFYESRDSLVNVCNKYDLNLDQIIEEL